MTPLIFELKFVYSLYIKYLSLSNIVHVLADCCFVCVRHFACANLLAGGIVVFLFVAAAPRKIAMITAF